MMRAIPLLALMLCQGVSLHAQPFPIGSRNITFNDPARGGRAIACEVYYPAAVAGSNQPVAPGRFPVLAFGHGFVMGVNAYYNLRDAFVPQGYILVLPTTEGGFSPSHGNFGQDLAFVILAMQQRGADPTSPFFERVASTAAIMGHSMGGGASFLGANVPQVTTVVNYAPAETNPSAIAAAGNVNKPVLVLAGSQDCVTPPSSNQLPMYNAVPSGCKAYVSLTGGGHCNFANNNFNCGFGEITCGGGGSLGRAAQQALTHQYTLLWLNRYLKDDVQAGAQFEALLAAGSQVTSQSVFTNCPPIRVRADLTVLLDGPYLQEDGLMRDDLRQAGLLPISEPYSALGFTHVGSGAGEVMDPALLAVAGPNAVVDWIFAELRDQADGATVLATANGLLRRNGTVVAPNGGALFFEALPGNYRIAVRHRNHLGVMTGISYALTREGTAVDLSLESTPVFGTEALRLRAGRALMWAGNVNGDDRLQYTGPNNDTDLILQAIGGMVPTSSASGYLTEDCNLDGVARFTGADNDRDLVLLGIGGVVPTAIRSEQLP